MGEHVLRDEGGDAGQQGAAAAEDPSNALGHARSFGGTTLTSTATGRRVTVGMQDLWLWRPGANDHKKGAGAAIPLETADPGLATACLAPQRRRSDQSG